MIWNAISWYFLFLLLGWLSFPLAFRLFRRLPDRAYTLSRTLGLLLWGFVFWLLTSLGVLQNQPGGILAGLAILIGLSIWAGWGRWREIWDWLRAHGRLILMVEIVFMLAFGFMVIVRASNPDATGTEKPMELAFINATLNSDTFPPHDPWLSGYAISYYHFGYILAAMLAKITTTTGGVAFNLMLVSVFALSASGAYGILYDLLSTSEDGGKRGRALGWALLGPIFLLFIKPAWGGIWRPGRRNSGSGSIWRACWQRHPSLIPSCRIATGGGGRPPASCRISTCWGTSARYRRSMNSPLFPSCWGTCTRTCW
jgi:hypothetical protein